MKIVKTKSELRDALRGQDSVGFVPTMGAFHEGHLELVKQCTDQMPVTVVSIFVNPTQFNNKVDYEKYPMDIPADIDQLAHLNPDVVFIPGREEIYPESIDPGLYIHDFGSLETRYEGHFRPGHFRGVGQVVHILFEIVQPHVCYFGEKDFQQLLVIKDLVVQMGVEIKIIEVPTVRERSGLAMSSRNRRLSEEERQDASLLFRVLEYTRSNIGRITPDNIRTEVREMFAKQGTLRLEYFDIVSVPDLVPVHSFYIDRPIRAIVAAYAGNVRLIDNLALD